MFPRQFHDANYYPSQHANIKPNSITLASPELAPNMFGASSELASVMEFGLYLAEIVLTLKKKLATTLHDGITVEALAVPRLI